jgi:hypothetical protein
MTLREPDIGMPVIVQSPVVANRGEMTPVTRPRSGIPVAVRVDLCSDPEISLTPSFLSTTRRAMAGGSAYGKTERSCQGGGTAGVAEVGGVCDLVVQLGQ